MTDKETALRNLEASTRTYLRVLEGLSAAEYDRRPAGDKWSIAEITEHVTVALRGTERLFQKLLLSQPLAPDDPARRWRTEQLAPLFADPERRIQAPAVALPKGRFADRAAAEAALRATTAGLAAWCRATDADLAAFGSAHPVLGALDGLQWLIVMAAHNERHARQVTALRASYV